MELIAILKSSQCFKLICGAGNENLEEVKRLVAIYASAGCRFFDLSASVEVLQAAQSGLDFAAEKKFQKGYHFCVSITAFNDPHANKALIDTEKCIKCSKCADSCPQSAINHNFHIEEKKCIGCLRCLKVCTNNAINIINHSNEYKAILPKLIEQGVSCIELHAQNASEEQALTAWEYLDSNFDGILSICMSRANIGDEQLITRLKKLLSKRKDYTTIIQADGTPISGGLDDYSSTLQAVATAQIIQKANLPAFLILSGGTNRKTKELTSSCQVPIDGIAFGSFARKIVNKYIKRDDFWDNKAVFQKAVCVAKELIKTIA